jgi:prepilin-type N-terminal cleavage/methylation domain-containing protein
MKKNFKKNRNTGFTLIETLISITVFLVVIIYGTASLLNAYAINRKSQATRSILDSLSFAMEDMSRNIRTGYNYACNSVSSMELVTPVSCPSGNSQIAFESAYGGTGNNGDQWAYYFSGTRLFKSTDSKTTQVTMNPDEVVIDTSQSGFIVIGAENSDIQQPLVIIKLVGTITSKNIVTPFSLQTTVSQRVSDV